MSGAKGRSGRPGKSIEELKLQGTYRKDRHDGIQLEVHDRVKLPVPDRIKYSGKTRSKDELFEAFSEHLHRQGMTQDVDTYLLEQLVEFQAVYEEAMAHYNVNPESMYGKKLTYVVAKEAAQEVRNLMHEYRMTPSTRKENGKGENGEAVADPVAAFLKPMPD